MRLWLLDEVEDIVSSLKGLIRVIVERADKERDILLPGYTHLQVRLIYGMSYMSVTLLYSVDNPSGGLTSCSPMHFRSGMISNDCNNLSLAFLSYPWAVGPWLEIPLPSTASSLRKS